MPDFHLPDIGEGLTEAEIVQWFVAVGDEIAVDDAVVELETAKTVVEIPSPFAGTVTHLAAGPGATVAVGVVLFSVEPDGVPPTGDAPSASNDSIGGTSALGRASTEGSASTVASEGYGRPVTADDDPPIRAMAIVRKLAADRGIDLASVTGTGPDGAITRADIEAFSSTPSDPPGELVALTPTRRAIAHHMTLSWHEIPHVTVQAEFRAEQLLSARRTGATTLSIEAVVATRVLPLLDEFPEFNARFTERGVLLRSDRHLGLAVDTEAGLVVVVVKHATDLTTEAIDTEFRRLTDAARNRTITVDEVMDQTFTISNIGALGGGHGTPIIPHGTTAILSIGRARETAVVVNGEIEVGLVAPLDLSYDHRVIDGGLGQRFLSAVVDALESSLT